MVAVPDTPSGESKTLVVYFSMPETTTADNMTTEEDNSVVVIDGEVLGNTQYNGRTPYIPTPPQKPSCLFPVFWFA